VPCDFLNPNSPNGITSTGETHIHLLNQDLTPDDIWTPSQMAFGNINTGTSFLKVIQDI